MALFGARVILRNSRHLMTLFGELVRRDLRSRYAGSYGGAVWTIAAPLTQAAVNAFVFSALMAGRLEGRGAGDVPFVVFYFIPFPLWYFFADSINRSTGILREYAYLINKVAFPYVLLPLVPTASAFIGQIVVSLVTAGLLIYHEVPVSAGGVALYFLIWVLVFGITVGASYAVASVSVYLSDMGQIVPVALNIVFWITPILYPVSLIEAYDSRILTAVVRDINPLSPLVDAARDAILTGSTPLCTMRMYGSVASSIGIIVVGTILFRRLRKGFADVL